jgi:membrane glycosyltransferase
MFPSSGITLLWLVIFMWYWPKFAGGLEVLIRRDQRKAFGGTARFLTGFTLEIIFSILMTPITWLNHAMFLCGLLFGKKSGWTGQTREDHSVPFAVALRQFWPHTLLGIFLISMLALTHPECLTIAVILLGGLTLSIPLAVMTSWPIFGRMLMRVGLFDIPEEITRPEALMQLDLAAYRSRPN